MAWKILATYGPQAAWMTAAFGCGLAYAYPHTYGLEGYKEMMTDRSCGVPVKTNIEAFLLADEIKKHFRWQETKLHTGKMFDLIQTKQLLDLSHKGSMNTIWGAVVSLPAMFSTNFLQETEDNPFDLLAYDIDVTTEEGQQILGSFKLSRAARKFALAKEMCHTNTYYVHFSFMGVTFSVLSCYMIATAISSFIPLRGAKMFSYMTVVPTLGFVTLKTGDYYNCHLQAKSDRKAASIDQEVAAGGVEYYTALIARKQALEKLKIQETSNDETMLKFGLGWRKTDLTLEERRDHLLKSVKQLYPDISLEFQL